jgi:hypothetical protein
MVKKSDPKPSNPNTVTIYGPGDDSDAAIAEAYLRPTVQAGATVRAYIKGKDEGGPGITALIAELGKQVEAVTDGDLKRAEAMLISQAHALDAIFGNLARRAVIQQHLPQYQAHLQLALKAQSQCRATLQTLVEVKYPRQMQFVRQQNVAVNQQVNNGTVPGMQTAGSRPGENKNEQSRLLEATDAERLDTGAPSTAGKAHS